jgi:hypothetical protein
MQALGSYKGGKMLFLGLRTGVGSAMILDGIVEPMDYDRLGNDSIADQHNSHARDRCGPAGEIWASRYANGTGAVDLYDLESHHALRFRRSNLAH